MQSEAIKLKKLELKAARQQRDADLTAKTVDALAKLASNQMVQLVGSVVAIESLEKSEVITSRWAGTLEAVILLRAILGDKGIGALGSMGLGGIAAMSALGLPGLIGAGLAGAEGLSLASGSGDLNLLRKIPGLTENWLGDQLSKRLPLL